MSSIRENPSQNANSVDPDQTPYPAASDLCLHCLPISLLWDARHGLKRARISHHLSFPYVELVIEAPLPTTPLPTPPPPPPPPSPSHTHISHLKTFQQILVHALRLNCLEFGQEQMQMLIEKVSVLYSSACLLYLCVCLCVCARP